MSEPIQGIVSAHGEGMAYAARSMATQLAQLQTHAENIANFGVPGYQKKIAMVRTFADHLGPDAVEQVTIPEVGRLRRSGQPLDLALNGPGYFQRISETSGEVELSRDGRMQVDKDGYLRSINGKQILSTAGESIRFPYIPQTPEKEIEISADGTITLYNPKNGQVAHVGQLAVVSPDGSVAQEIDVKQGYVEDSNVFLQQEFVSVMPLRRQFEASRQVFIIQSDSLSRMIQELGRAQ